MGVRERATPRPYGDYRGGGIHETARWRGSRAPSVRAKGRIAERVLGRLAMCLPAGASRTEEQASPAPPEIHKCATSSRHIAIGRGRRVTHREPRPTVAICPRPPTRSPSFSVRPRRLTRPSRSSPGSGWRFSAATSKVSCGSTARRVAGQPSVGKTPNPSGSEPRSG